MEPDRLVLDTDIIIHLLKKQPQTVARFIELLEAQTVFCCRLLSWQKSMPGPSSVNTKKLKSCSASASASA